MEKELIKLCTERGVLLDREIFKVLGEIDDIECAKVILEKIKNSTQQRIITKDIIFKNYEDLNKSFVNLSEESQKKFEKIKVKLGLSIEVSKEIVFAKAMVNTNEFSDGDVRVFSPYSIQNKKLEVADFVKYFRSRFSEMQSLMQEHSELKNLVSIGKISGNQRVSLIGLVSNKSITKNKNLMFEFEDLTGKINIVVNKERKELYKKAEEIALDSVIGVIGVGGKDIFFVNDIFFPDAVLPERKNSPVEELVLFVSDLHIGSKLFMEENFMKFIDYLNGKIPGTPEVEKIKYLFIVGDLVAGVGNYPNQENELALSDLESHFGKAAEMLGKIRNDIKIIISPGNHDGIRLMEPQPIFNEKFAWQLYNMKNVILTTNPAEINIGQKKNFDGFNVLTYHGVSYLYYAGNINYLMMEKATHNPELIMKYLLKNRHLAPTHASTQYFPSEKDVHIIKNIPDIFVSGHLHKSAVTYYNNVLVVSTSGWEKMTAYMEKVGAKPDFCKVPMFNLKTRAVKILDFE